jgi:hypothetical protein
MLPVIVFACLPHHSGQNSVLKSEAQAILGLCGLGITVTGFSGGNVIRSGLSRRPTSTHGLPRLPSSLCPCCKNFLSSYSLRLAVEFPAPLRRPSLFPHCGLEKEKGGSGVVGTGSLPAPLVHTAGPRPPPPPPGTLASGLLVAGIVLLLLAGSVALRAMTVIRWITEASRGPGECRYAPGAVQDPPAGRCGC